MLRQTQLIIRDEASMTHKHYFEALDRSLRDIMSNHPNLESTFSGKVIVFGGDLGKFVLLYLEEFVQILYMFH